MRRWESLFASSAPIGKLIGGGADLAWVMRHQSNAFIVLPVVNFGISLSISRSLKDVARSWDECVRLVSR